MNRLIALFLAGAIAASADTIRIRVTVESTGVTNATTVAITGTNRVEQIKGWAATRSTNTTDAALADGIAAEIRAAAAEWKRQTVRAAKIEEANAAAAKVQE